MKLITTIARIKLVRCLHSFSLSQVHITRPSLATLGVQNILIKTYIIVLQYNNKACTSWVNAYPTHAIIPSIVKQYLFILYKCPVS